MSATTWRYRENVGRVRILARSTCRCGEDLRAAPEYISAVTRFSVAGAPHAPAFYHFCVPCGLDNHQNETHHERG